jgi:hypothetical protein
MHPEMLRALAAQRSRDLREEAASHRRSRGAGSLKVQAPSSAGRHRIFALRRAADPSPVRSNLPAVATAPGPTSIGIPATATATATVPTRHDRVERNAS